MTQLKEEVAHQAEAAARQAEAAAQNFRVYS